MKAAKPFYSEADLDRDQWQRSFRRKYWIGVSIVVSSIILCVSFAVPFQQDELSLQKPAQKPASPPAANPVARSIEPTEVSPAPTNLNDRYLKEMQQLEAHFMQQVRERRQRAKTIPTAEQMRERWQQIHSRRSQHIESLKNARPRSLEARYREELIEAAADGPAEVTEY